MRPGQDLGSECQARKSVMSHPEERPPTSASQPDWRGAWAGVAAGSAAGGQVGGLAALLLTVALLFVGAYYDPLLSLGPWLCCGLLLLGVPLLIGGLGGSFVGMFAGFVHGLTGKRGLGAVAGLTASALTVAGLAVTWFAWYGNGPARAWLIPAGTFLGILLAGPWSGVVDPYAIRAAGQTEVPGPFRRLFGLRLPPPKPRKEQPPRVRPEHPEGIEEDERRLRE